MERIRDFLPELGQIFVEDLRNSELDWLDVFSGYVLLFNTIEKVFSLPEKGQHEAVKSSPLYGQISIHIAVLRRPAEG